MGFREYGNALRLLGLALVLAAFGVNSARASEKNDDALLLAPVVVTAEKHEANVQEVPASVTAFTSERIEDSRIESIEDFSRQAPNMFISNWGIRGNSFVFMRGIGAVNNDPAIGFYVDDVNYMDYRVFDSPLHDIERIEVLRGPQGTLYGRNSLAGVVNIVTKKPDNEYHAGIEQTVGNYSLFETKAYARAPLIDDTLFLGVSGQAETRDGYSRNDYLGGDVDHRNDLNGRMHLRWTPNEDLDVTYSLDGENVDDGAFPLTQLARVHGDPHHVDYDYEGKNLRDAVGTSLRVAYDAECFRLTSISAYRHYDETADNDQDFTRVFLYNASEHIDDHQYTQEFRFASPEDNGDFKWLAGLYGHDSKQDHELDIAYAPGVVLPTLVNQDTDADLTTQGYAVFGQATYTFFDKLDVTAGLRYDYEKSSADYTAAWSTGGAVFTNSALDGNVDGEAWLPKFQVDYRWTPEFMTYASVSEGYRGAGFNTAAPTPADFKFNPEYSWNYETGFKSSWFDNRVTFNAAAFYIEIDDQQVVQLLPTLDTVIRNAGESTSKGFELESTALLAKDLLFEAGFGYTDAVFEKYTDPVAGLDYAGNKTPLAPEYTYNLALQYRYPLVKEFTFLGTTSPLKLFSRLEMQGIGPFYWNKENTLRQEAYELVNMRLGFETDNYELMFWAKNLFNQEYDAVAFEFPGSAPVGEAGDPLTFGVTVGARF